MGAIEISVILIMAALVLASPVIAAFTSQDGVDLDTLYDRTRRRLFGTIMLPGSVLMSIALPGAEPSRTGCPRKSAGRPRKQPGGRFPVARV